MIVVMSAKAKPGSPARLLDKVKKFSSKHNVKIAVLNADFVLGKDHLLSACRHALKAFDRHKNISKNLETEVLLYTCGERQIKSALAKVGIKENTEHIAFVIIGKCSISKLLSELGVERDDKLLEGNFQAKLKNFRLTKNELSAVSTAKDLILERIAMLRAKK